MNALRVVVADDHSLTLQGVSDSLISHGISIVGRGRSAGEAVALVKEQKPDALVTDLDFGPGPTGLDIAESLRATLPKLGIVVLSAYGDPRLHSDSLTKAPPSRSAVLLPPSMMPTRKLGNGWISLLRK